MIRIIISTALYTAAAILAVVAIWSSLDSYNTQSAMIMGVAALFGFVGMIVDPTFDIRNKNDSKND